MRKTKEKNNKGITLIALIITIIVMLILVSVTIAMAVNGGLFDYAGKATRETKDAIKDEQWLANGGIQIGDVYYTIDEYLAQVKENDGSRIKLSYTVTPAEDNLSAVITVNARMLGGLIKGYEEYETWALKKLEGKSPEEKIQMFIDADVFWYPEDYSEIENVTLEDVLETWECDTIEECWQENYDSFDEALIGWGYVYPEQYEYWDDYYLFAKKELRGKTPEEIEQIFVDGQNYWNEVNEQGMPYFKDIHELEKFILENYSDFYPDCEDIYDIAKVDGFDTLADYAIDMRFVYPEKYSELYGKLQDMVLHIMDPSGETWRETNTVEFTVYRDGEYTFKATNETGTESNSITVNVDVFGYKYKVGDYVNYTPDTGTYKVAGGDYGTGYTSTQSFTTNTSLKWRILSIDEQTGEIELIAEKEVHTLYLKGENGYNHGVDILNDLCEELYSKILNGEKVAVGRSINGKDMGVQRIYGKIYTIDNKYYPALYAMENALYIDGIKQQGEMTESIGLNDGVVSNNITTYKTITGSFEGSNVSFTKFELSGQSDYPDIFNADNAYWLAERFAVRTNSETFEFGLRRFTEGIISEVGGYGLYYSSDVSQELKYAVRPIVELDYSAQLSYSSYNSDLSYATWNLNF